MSRYALSLSLFITSLSHSKEKKKRRRFVKGTFRITHTNYTTTYTAPQLSEKSIGTHTKAFERIGKRIERSGESCRKDESKFGQHDQQIRASFLVSIL